MIPSSCYIVMDEKNCSIITLLRLITYTLVLAWVHSYTVPRNVGFTTSTTGTRRESDRLLPMRGRIISVHAVPTLLGANAPVPPPESHSSLAPNHVANFSATLSFPSYDELMQLRHGEFVVSDTVIVKTCEGRDFHFRVKLYPRGGGHFSHQNVRGGRPQSGFGMSYKVLPLLGGVDEKVGAYLEYLPTNSTQDSVDATFALRLCGRQSPGPRFDVEWRAGMRFVSVQNSKLAEGRANDFGAHLMETGMLADFLGLAERSLDNNDYGRLDETRTEKVSLKVEILIHRDPVHSYSEIQHEASSFNGGIIVDDIRKSSDSGWHDPYLRVGRVVVPLLRKLAQRPKMFAYGVYPGVEYRILRIIDPDTNIDLFYSKPGVDYELKPIYPLVNQLERQWPVRINEKEIPKLFTPNMYNALSAVLSGVTAVSGLLAAFIISQAISVFVIPSRSMEPTLQVGDVLLVEKVTPRLLSRNQKQMVNQVVLFYPPQPLKDIVAQSGGRLNDRDLFVKRIASGPGSQFTVEKSGSVRINGMPPIGRRDLCEAEPLRLIEKLIQPVSDNDSKSIISDDEVVVLGDCSSVSVDSRVWGPLPTSNIIGRPIIRIWPLQRFGPLQSLTVDWSD